MEVKAGYKQTEVGVIPIEWDVVHFQEATHLITCGLAATPTYVPESMGKPFLSAQNVHGGRVVLDNYKFIGHELFEQITRHNKPEKGDLLYTRVGAGIGEAGIIQSDLEFGIYVSLTLIKTNSRKLHNSFAMHLLNSTRYRSLAKSGQFAGGGVQNLNVEVVRRFLIPLPPLSEQRAVADALSDVDALLGALNRLISKKRDIKQAAMQELLTGKKRLPGFNGKWEVMRLGGVCGKITTGKLDANAMVTDGDYPFFTCARENYWIDKYAFDYEALLVSGNGANVGYVHYYNGKFNAYQRTYVISEFTANVQFIKTFLVRNIQDRIRVEVNAGNTPYITMGTLTEMEITLPPSLVEQSAIAEVLSDMDTELAALEQRREKTRSLKQGMMQELLTGRTRLIENG
jgi:type I restriction enzyme S subunit